MLAMLVFLFGLVIGYLSGSVCSAVIVSHIFALPDPRTEGSQNPGATNVLRLAGKKYALLVLLADILKGLLPVVFVKILGAGDIITSFTGLAAVLGHMYPVFFNFKGGKGVATALGMLLGLHFLLGICVIVTWLIVASFSRYSSLSSLISISLAPIYSLFILGNAQAFIPLLFVALVVLYKHRHNINRLLHGTEPKIVFKKKRQHNI